MSLRVSPRCILTLALFVFSAGLLGATEVYVRSLAVRSNAALAVSDLAVFPSLNAAALSVPAAGLEALELGNSGAALVGPAVLETVLRDSIPQLAGESLALVGGPLLILPAGQEASSPFFASLLGFLSAELAIGDDALAVQMPESFRLAETPAGVHAFRLDARPLWSGSSILRIRVWDRQGSGIERPIALTLRRFRYVAVAEGELAAETTLDASSIRLRLTDLSRIAGEAVPPGSDFSQLQTRRSIRAGQAVLNTDVRRIQLVRGGEEVRIVFEFDTVSLTIVGRALRSAALGEETTVQHSLSSQRFTGVVSGRGEVRVAMQN